MAKQTRAQRRARRAEQQRNGTDAAPVQRRGPAMAAPSGGDRTAAERRVPGSGFRRFVGESWAELKKVEWPGQPQLIQGTTVVLIACVIVGLYLWLSDLAFKRLVENVFLGQ
jgi:preprotein translocase subunit SecE